MMISKRYFLARRNTVRELNSFCSRVSSAMRKLFLRACDKARLSLYLSEWMEWKCKSVTQSVGFLYRVVESLPSAPIFVSRKDIYWLEYSMVNLIVGWSMFMK